VQAVALRTWNELDRHGGIKAWYAAMFRKAKRSIYIENQFPFQNSFATSLLENRLQEEHDLKVIIVSPIEPNLPGLIGSMIAKMSVNDVRDNLAALRRAGEGRVKTYSLISQHAAIGAKRRQIYVHSKIMVVDDKWVTVGSANIDKNGFKDSSELNLGMTSPRLAQELRARLWQEHLQDFASDFADFEHGFYMWEKVANENGRRVAENRAIKGHVYYYNFKEMDILPPYPEAKESTKFELL
jgi:phosphatidylserine/phosphatidylglycerophosphate/cardiolipin synthase-like enzyme